MADDNSKAEQIHVGSQAYAEHYRGYLYNSTQGHPLFVTVPLDIGLRTFKSIDDLRIDLYIRAPFDLRRIRDLNQTRTEVEMSKAIGNPDLPYNLIFFYQEQKWLRRVRSTPLPTGTGNDIHWRGDILVVKISKDGQRMLDLDPTDVPEVNDALIW